MDSGESSTAGYAENHLVAVLFTAVAAASQGIGGLVAVTTLRGKAYGSQMAHLMSFSTGVMIYLSFMDIMFDTTAEIGEMASGAAFFAGMMLFLLLEVSLPEVEGTQFASIFSWTDSSASPPSKILTEIDEHALATESQGAIVQPFMNEGQSMGHKVPSVRRRTSMPENATASRNDHAATPPRKRSYSAPQVNPMPSPPPSAKRLSFRLQGEQGLSDKRKKSIAFSGMMAMISISLHNIPEGIAVYLTCLKGVKSGVPLAVAMALHNIPEGMAVAGPLFAATKSRTTAVVAATVSGAFEVLGCLLVQLYFNDITPFFMESMLSLVAGIMVSLALVELLPSCLEVLTPVEMACSNMAGMVFMFLSKQASDRLVELWFELRIA